MLRRVVPISGALFGLMCSLALPAAAAPTLRVQVDQKGDFVAIGNTLGWDCGANPPMPVVGTVPAAGMCGANLGDSAPDVHWRSDDAAGTAAASTANTAAQARSTAVLALPSGATVTHAFLYWAAKSAVGIDATATLDKLDGGGTVVGTLNATALAADQFSLPSGTDTFYQSVVDVTTFVQTQGVGAYRVSDVDSVEFAGRNDETNFGAWSLVVLYQNNAEPPRNLVIFDGLDQVQNGAPAAATLSGFLVPLAGFDAKLGVITYEGDSSLNGDQLRFGTAPLNAGDALTDALNPQNNFFNATRSLLGAAVSVAGDLPQLTGGPASMGGYDLDVVDITNQVGPGQTSADIEATSSADLYLLGAFITSISTFKPDLSTSDKSVEDVNGGALVPNDQLRFTVTAINSGNDNAINVIMNDPLPSNVTYVADSIQIVDGPNAGTMTDAAADDQAEYDSGSHTIFVRLGTGADAVNGGALDVGESTTVAFLVTVNGDASGTIQNQAFINFEGELGSPPEETPTDGNGTDPGTPPTEVGIDECLVDEDCPEDNPACFTDDDPNICVPCTTDEHCDEPTPICDTDVHECVECDDDQDCPGENSDCDETSKTCQCDPTGGAEICNNDIDEDCDGELDNGCGCMVDADCPGPADDGIICTDNMVCGPGCRGSDENSGCPGSQICSSKDASIGKCTPGIFAQGGCSCNAPGTNGSRAALTLLALALGLTAARRRRRRDRRSR